MVCMTTQATTQASTASDELDPPQKSIPPEATPAAASYTPPHLCHSTTNAEAAAPERAVAVSAGSATLPASATIVALQPASPHPPPAQRPRHTKYKPLDASLLAQSPGAAQAVSVPPSPGQSSRAPSHTQPSVLAVWGTTAQPPRTQSVVDLSGPALTSAGSTTAAAPSGAWARYARMHKHRGHDDYSTTADQR